METQNLETTIITNTERDNDDSGYESNSSNNIPQQDPRNSIDSVPEQLVFNPWCHDEILIPTFEIPEITEFLERKENSIIEIDDTKINILDILESIKPGFEKIEKYDINYTIFRFFNISLKCDSPAMKNTFIKYHIFEKNGDFCCSFKDDIRKGIFREILDEFDANKILNYAQRLRENEFVKRFVENMTNFKAIKLNGTEYELYEVIRLIPIETFSGLLKDYIRTPICYKPLFFNTEVFVDNEKKYVYLRKKDYLNLREREDYKEFFFTTGFKFKSPDTRIFEDSAICFTDLENMFRKMSNASRQFPENLQFFREMNISLDIFKHKKMIPNDEKKKFEDAFIKHRTL